MKTIKQFVKFGIVGISNTVIGYVVYALSLKLYRALSFFPKYDIYLAQLVMFIISVAWSFYWNNKYVFHGNGESKKWIISALLKTYASYAFTSLVLSEVLLAFLVKSLKVNEFIAPILILIVTVPLNFLIQKYWAFKKK